MSKLKDLGQDRLTVLLKLLSSQNLCKAVRYNNADFLEHPDIDNANSLIYDYIFPYKKIPDTANEAKTLITMSFNRYRPISNAFKSGIISLNILVHKDNIRTDYGMLRTDFIASEIDALLQDRGIGIGMAQFNAMDDIYVNSDYLGTVLEYKIIEFN